MSKRTLLKVLGTLAVMAASGVAAAAAALTFLMNVGLKLHDNYEYYGGRLGLAVIVACGTIGVATPAILAWRLEKNSWRVSLRAFFVVMFLVALMIAVYSLSL